MGLDIYRQRRDFHKTPEPAGTPGSAGSRMYVFHKHAARQLHYDLRLELDGVLLSWAVPKGPSLDPRSRHLAVRVEDHPVEYAMFEGVIPEGEYGAGTVQIWDRGTWEPEADPHEGLAKGELRFKLHSEKLKGGWVLVKMKSRSQQEGRDNWLLVKHRDEYAVDHDGQAILRERPESVVSGRSLEEIAADARTDIQHTDQPANVQLGDSSAPTAEVPLAEKTRDGDIRRPSSKGVPEDEGTVELSHPNRVFWPADRVTKGDLARYYERVAEWMMPHVLHRPISMVRCPDGVGGVASGVPVDETERCFFQKHPGSDFPGPFGRVEIEESEGPQTYLTITEPASLVALAQMAVLEIHVWGSRWPDIEHPDIIVFDLDPDPVAGWRSAVEGARFVRTLLKGVELDCFVKTTGGKGLHVVTPIKPTQSWEVVTGFAKAVADTIASCAPDRYTSSPSRVKRQRKVFVDYLRNTRSAAFIAPYSTRARERPTISVPVRWEELSRVRSDSYTLKNLPNRLARLTEDPWKGYLELQRSQMITPDMQREIGLRYPGRRLP